VSIANTAEPDSTVPSEDDPAVRADESAMADPAAKEAEDSAASDPEADSDEEREEEAEPDPHAKPPAFWSAERKALWDRITDPEARAAIHAHEKERVAATSRKIEEAALARKALEERVQQFGHERDELTQWLTEAGPRMAQAFQGRWGQYDWPKLATENPAEFVRLSAQRDAEFAAIQQAAQRHQQELQAARGRAAEIVARTREAEAEKLARQYPEHFGLDTAGQTYDELGRYLAAQGVPQERIHNTFESSIVGVALKAMLYDKAQAALRTRNASAPVGPSTTATQTPRRIAPGPGNRPGHPAGEAARQAEQRLRTGQALSDEDVATLFG
jgi:hypothetical protein